MSNDYWPDDLVTRRIETPVKYLRIAARELNDATKGLLVSEVQSAGTPESMLHKLIVRAPTLNDYTVSLAHIKHDTKFYPVNLVFSHRSYDSIMTPEDLDSFLREGLKNDDVVMKVRSLLALVQPEEEWTEPIQVVPDPFGKS